MENDEIYLSYNEAFKIGQSFLHYIGTEFKSSTSGHIYQIFTVNPIPFNEINEFRELLSTFIQTQGANKIELQLFESRARNDNFIVLLCAKTKSLNTGLNLLSIGLRRYVQEDGSLKYGFPVDRNLNLF